ncbi:MAG: tRNA (adenosine(37)-N6)-threonylcarbamoyltransferase complex transferase subunit TsaD [Bacteroidia bacterium]|nr:tRNA (adenosine(37)-N6)-threonylcarbamoyltransferase complex transferase subunit TsaD [Bacteroidia bacterium]
MQTEIIILAIETSCDDTSCAVLKNRKVLSNVVSSQQIHRMHGGVVPELAGRDHLRYLIPVIDEAIKLSGTEPKQFSAIAVTRGPGLPGSLQVGVNAAKSLSMAWQKPLIAVHHMRAHILSLFIEKEGQQPPEFPFLCLTVSGGHTQLVLAENPYDFKIIGKTLDDAVGEAFDKAAKLLGLPYPGGPIIDRLAQSGDENKFSFSPYYGKGLDFSFSGIKTSFLYFLKENTQHNQNFIRDHLPDICASYQKHLVGELMKVTRRALESYPLKNLVISGGVSANSKLRKEFSLLEKEGIRVFFPLPEFCTDNAAMVGITAYFDYQRGFFSDLNIAPLPRWNVFM